jgi:hypothetical protein
VAETRSKELRARNLYPRLGCLAMVAVVGVPFLTRGLAAISPYVVLGAGLAVLVLLVVLRGATSRALRTGNVTADDVEGRGCLALMLATLGLSLTLTGIVQLSRSAGTAWLGWTIAAAIGVLSLAVALTVARTNVPGLMGAVSTARREGCRIAFLRPFHEGYSEKARNLLIPILANYGHLYFVSDATFASTKADDSYFARDYRSVPGLIAGHTLAHEEWQRRVAAALGDTDVAVIDVSVLSAGVLWELNECYRRFPAHRILLVAAGDAFGDGPLEALLPVIQAHAVRAVEAIIAFNPDVPAEDPRRHLKPLLLVYLDRAEGRLWLASAIHVAMLNIVSIETTGQPVIAAAG